VKPTLKMFREMKFLKL